MNNGEENNNIAPEKKPRKLKISYVEFFVIFIVFITVTIYLIPKWMLSSEQKQYGRLQINTAMMTSKVLSKFSDNTNKQLPSEIAKELTEEMNTLCKNPIDKKNPAYSLEECLGCVVIEADDKAKSIVLSAKDKDGKLVARTIIQPPSYVTYNRDLKENNEK